MATCKMSGMSVFSKIKHRGMTHSNFLLTVTVQSLTVEGVVLPEFLFLKWGTTRQVNLLPLLFVVSPALYTCIRLLLYRECCRSNDIYSI